MPVPHVPPPSSPDPVPTGVGGNPAVMWLTFVAIAAVGLASLVAGSSLADASKDHEIERLKDERAALSGEVAEREAAIAQTNQRIADFCEGVTP